MPIGKPITVCTTNMPERIVVWWFNPKNAQLQKGGCDAMEFTSPTLGPGNDWVLIIHDTSMGFKAPWSDTSGSLLQEIVRFLFSLNTCLLKL